MILVLPVKNLIGIFVDSALSLNVLFKRLARGGAFPNVLI